MVFIEEIVFDLFVFDNVVCRLMAILFTAHSVQQAALWGPAEPLPRMQYSLLTKISRLGVADVFTPPLLINMQHLSQVEEIIG